MFHLLLVIALLWCAIYLSVQYSALEKAQKKSMDDQYQSLCRREIIRCQGKQLRARDMIDALKWLWEDTKWMEEILEKFTNAEKDWEKKLK